LQNLPHQCVCPHMRSANGLSAGPVRKVPLLIRDCSL
jgi:hypothetical protein